MLALPTTAMEANAWPVKRTVRLASIPPERRTDDALRQQAG